jgi:hypothetical protein
MFEETTESIPPCETSVSGCCLFSVQRRDGVLFFGSAPDGPRTLLCRWLAGDTLAFMHSMHRAI